MYGINLTLVEAIELALLILFPVLLWIVYKFEDIYRKKKKARHYREIDKIFGHKGINKNIKRKLTAMFERYDKKCR